MAAESAASLDTLLVSSSHAASDGYPLKNSARGIPESEARGLLIHAFLQEVVDGIEDEGLRGTAVEFIESGLAWAMESAS